MLLRMSLDSSSPKLIEVTLTLGDSVIVEATSEKGRSFCSKQAAKATGHDKRFAWQWFRRPLAQFRVHQCRRRMLPSVHVSF